MGRLPIAHCTPFPRASNDASLAEANTVRWETLLEKGLSILGKTLAEARNERKSAASKVWIAERLQMGAPQSVSVLTSRLKKAGEQRRAPAVAELSQNITK